MTTPIDPTTLSGLKLYCRARSSQTARVSGNVQQWDDASGNGNHLIQNTTSKQPRFVDDAGDGLPSVQFDGVDDVFTTLTSIITGAGSPFTLIGTARVADGLAKYACSIGGAAGGTANVALKLDATTGTVTAELATDNNSSSGSVARLGAASEFATICLREDTAVGSTFIPSNLSSLALWLEADTNVALSGSTVTSWQDVRGGANPTMSISGTPQILSNVPQTGQHAIRMSGSDSMTSAFTLGANVTIFTVYKQVAIFAASSHDIIFDGNTAVTCIYGTDTGDGDFLYAGSALANTTPAGPTLGVYDYVTIQFNGASSVVRRHGTSETLSTNPGSGAAMNGLSIGSVGRFPQIDIAAVIVFDRILSPTEIAQVEGYITAKYFGGGLLVANFLQRGGIDASDTTTTTPGGNAAAMSGTSFLLGAKGSGSPFVPASFFQGQWRDVMVFDRKLTDAEYQGVFAWLKTVQGVDIVPPTVTNFSPAQGSTVSASTPLSFDITDVDSTGAGVVYHVLPNGTMETVVDNNTIGPNFGGLTVTNISGGVHVSIPRTGGWVYPEAVIVIQIADGDGNVTLATYAVQVSNPSPPDTTAPTVTNFSPPIGAGFPDITRTTPLEFDVADNAGLRRVVVKAIFQDLDVEEIVHDGDGFSPGYSTSSRSAIAGGFHYLLARRGGWPAAPTIKVIAIDDSGNEV